MKTESEVKTDSVKRARKAGWYARRFEDQYAVGLPDTFYSNWGMAFFVEWKIIRNKDLSFGPTPRQKIELDRISNSGINAIVAGYLPETSHVIMYNINAPEATRLSGAYASHLNLLRIMTHD